MIGAQTENSAKKDKPSKKETKIKKHEKNQSAAGGRDHSQETSAHSADTENKWDKQKFTWLGVVTLVSFVTKFYGLGTPNEVVFDEVHFGKFASSYIKREYFFDVHPPLGKLLLAAIGYIFGYDGSFAFLKINDSYKGSQVPYEAMRAFSALLGTLVVPVIYAMLIEMRFSLPIALLGASMIAFDNALVTQCRFILLDAQLIFFIIVSCYCWIKFRSQTNKPFSTSWWLWLIGTGVFLGLALGVKLVGIFVIAAVGVCTVLDLWDIMDIKKTKEDIIVIYHWIARIAVLVGIPTIIFLISYWIHFKVAYRSGSGDEHMSSEFQATLQGNLISETRSPVYYGSIITLLSNVEKTYLYSHNHTYPLNYEGGKVGSEGQQVSGFRDIDDNNDWYILPEITDPPIDYVNDPRIPVKAGDIIRLKHVETGKVLMTHDVASPLTLTNQEVTAINDTTNVKEKKYPQTLWQLEVVRGGKILESKVTVFKLKHQATNTHLMNYKENLPEWGFGYREINAGRNEDKRILWTVDDILFQSENGTWVNKTESESLANTNEELTFWGKLSELISVTVEKNAKLADKSPYLTAPLEWPFLVRGTSFWVSNDRTQRIYLLGNPLTWFISIFTLPIFITLILIDQLVEMRLGKNELFSAEEKRVIYPKGLFFLLCYLLHYLPSFFMDRVVYFHHYLPCYIFNALIFTTLYQTLAIRLPILNHPAVVGVLCSAIAGVFLQFSSLIYGTPHDEEFFNSLKWISTWHF